MSLFRIKLFGMNYGIIIARQTVDSRYSACKDVGEQNINFFIAKMFTS